MQEVHFLLTCVAQKRLYLSFLTFLPSAFSKVITVRVVRVHYFFLAQERRPYAIECTFPQNQQVIAVAIEVNRKSPWKSMTPFWGTYMRRPRKKGKFLGRFSLKIRVGNGMCRMRSVTLFSITTLIFVLLFRTWITSYCCFQKIMLSHFQFQIEQNLTLFFTKKVVNNYTLLGCTYLYSSCKELPSRISSSLSFSEITYEKTS